MAINPAKLLLKPGKTALLICDIQSKFSNVTFEFDKMVANTTKLINACKLLNVPMIVTEQNPRALGPTVPEFNISGAKGPFGKTQFSMCIPEVKEALSKICSGGPPDAVLLVGQEAHVCIEITSAQLRKDGFEVHAVVDCISSGTQEDRLYALDRIKEIGCILATSESVIFNLIGDSNHAQFKNILGFFRPVTGEMRIAKSSTA